MRTFELARELGLDIPNLIDRLWQLGVIADANSEISRDVETALRGAVTPNAPEERPAEATPEPSRAATPPADPPRTGSGIRVYQFATTWGIDSATVLERAAALALGVADHLAWLSPAQIVALEADFAKRPPDGRIEERISQQVKRRRRPGGPRRG